MDQWLQQHLACPRDHLPLTQHEQTLVCPEGHRYPIYDGIPVLLVDSVEQTIGFAHHSLAIAHGEATLDSSLQMLDSIGIHPYVQQAIAATNGILYRQQINRLRYYPIPELRLPPGEGRTLLDLGCNWGRWTIAAARKGYCAIGIDPSLEAVLAARHIARQTKLDAQFLVADARYLPFRDASFDQVFSYSVLQHLSDEDVQCVLQDVQRVLVADGQCLIQMANGFGIRSLYHQGRRKFRQAHAFEVRYRTPQHLQHMFSFTIGPATLSVDGFFGLGIQKSDLPLMPPHFQAIIIASETLRQLSRRLPGLMYAADSLYVTAQRKG